MRLQWLRELGPLLLLWIAFVVITNLIGEASIREMRIYPESRWRMEQIQTQNRWMRWDAFWYVRIAEDGYTYEEGKGTSSVGFFPLYPLVIRLVDTITPLDEIQSGVWISRVCLLLAMWLLLVYARDRGAYDRRYLPAVALLFFPGAYILGAVYAESLFLVLTLGAFIAAERKRSILAFLLALGAGATRIHGLVLAPSLALLAVMQYRDGDTRLRLFLPPVGAVLGCAAFGLFTFVQFGDFLLYLHHRSAWDQSPRSPVGPAADFFNRFVPFLTGGYTPIRRFAQLACLGAAAVATAVLAKRKRHHEALLFIALIATNLVSGTLDGIQRYLVFCFPLFLLLAETAKGRVLWPVYLFAGALMQAFNIFRYVNYQTPPP